MKVGFSITRKVGLKEKGKHCWYQPELSSESWTRSLVTRVRSSLIWSYDQSSAWFMLRGSLLSCFSSHAPLAFVLLSFKTFVPFTWMYSTGRLFLVWEFWPWMQITFLNLSQLVQEVCLMNHLEKIKKGIKRRKTNAEHFTTLEQPINYLIYAKDALHEALFQTGTTGLCLGPWRDRSELWCFKNVERLGPVEISMPILWNKLGSKKKKNLSC